jgi:hypothetical protein
MKTIGKMQLSVVMKRKRRMRPKLKKMILTVIGMLPVMRKKSLLLSLLLQRLLLPNLLLPNLLLPNLLLLRRFLPKSKNLNLKTLKRIPSILMMILTMMIALITTLKMIVLMKNSQLLKSLLFKRKKKLLLAVKSVNKKLWLTVLKMICVPPFVVFLVT